jgi:hypothetical protein
MTPWHSNALLPIAFLAMKIIRIGSQSQPGVPLNAMLPNRQQTSISLYCFFLAMKIIRIGSQSQPGVPLNAILPAWQQQRASNSNMV